jgi:hypothetical protein
VGRGAAGTDRTLSIAAGLIGLTPDRLRADPAANIRGGAALLARYQGELDAPRGSGSDLAGWYGAVARYSGASDLDGARSFADDVYAVLASGARRMTDDGHQVRLAAAPASPDRSQLDRLEFTASGVPAGGTAGAECPAGVSCSWIPAPYRALGAGTDPGRYGTFDVHDRPARQQVSYIVIHDTGGSYSSAVSAVNPVQDARRVSWHYTIRSSDGRIAQHVPTRDVAWQAGNWYVNAASIGVEHEGPAASGTWFTEAMYRSSARLVRYLADRFGVPLDRAHIIGHDNVPGMVPGTVAGMHSDPGPYWDWAHYFTLLGAPLAASGSARSGLVMIKPSFTANRPVYTGCAAAGRPCPVRRSSEVVLRTAPNPRAPLVADVGLRPNGAPATMAVADTGARAGTGQRYVVAERRGDWTAIWYLGAKAWFSNPASAPTAVRSAGQVATPKPDRTSIPVYGRAYPEAAAYPAGGQVQPIVALPYTLPAGQYYSVGATVAAEYYRAFTVDGSAFGDRTVVRGSTRYVQIQFGHRIMFVDANDVVVSLG